jgi:hypothetical protein
MGGIGCNHESGVEADFSRVFLGCPFPLQLHVARLVHLPAHQK